MIYYIMKRNDHLFKFLFFLSAVLFLATGCETISLNTSLSYVSGLNAQREMIRLIFYNGAEQTIQGNQAAHNGSQSDSVIASTFDFSETDSTKILQAAFDSGARNILIPKMNKPWITEQLYIRSNSTIFFEEGCELAAKAGSFQGTSEALINVNDVENVTIFGYGASIRMHKEEYRKAPYKKGEWRHTINITGCKNVSIYGISAIRSGGDGIYLGRGKLPYNDTVLIEDVILHDHYRQGISVICAQNLVIRNCEIKDTEGTPPAAGIDFEPNAADEPLTNCEVSGCVITNNVGGIIVSVDPYDKTSMPFSITIERCTIKWNFYSIALWYTEKDTRGELIMKDNNLCGIYSMPPKTKDLHIIRE